MTAVRVTVSLLLGLAAASDHSSICTLHELHETFYTDLNYMIRENGSLFWYVLAFRQPDLPYLTLYHLPKDLAANRNCYSYLLSTEFGVITMTFLCPGKKPFHSFDLLTRPDGSYITTNVPPQEVTDFRPVHVLRLTKKVVLLVSCSTRMDTYGVLVLHRGGWQSAQDKPSFLELIGAKLPPPLHRWMNFTLTNGTRGSERCLCTNEYAMPVRTAGRGGIEQDKRKVFVLATLGVAVAVAVVVKFLKRLFRGTN